MSDTAEIWKKRVARWRVSGETAEEFSEGRPWSPKTLRWWASRLGRPTAMAAGPVVRVAQLIRSSAPAERERGAVVIEALDARLRITIESGADREMAVAMLGMLVPEVR